MIIEQFATAIRFFTRLPVPKALQQEGVLAQSVWAFPLVGAIIGAIAAFIYTTLLSLGITYTIAAWITLGLMVLLTGGLHEDGLADMADGLAAGRDREQKLAIMRDSRIGSYGVIALIIILALRANAMSGFGDTLHTFWAFVAAGACSRVLLAVMMHVVPSARTDGLAVMAGTPARNQVLVAVLLGIASLFFLGGVKIVFLSVCVLAIICVAIARAAGTHFGGITGDVLGAAQQIAEAVLLILFVSLQLL